MKHQLRKLILLLTGAVLFTTTAQAELSAFNLPGNSENYGWSFTRDNYDPGTFGTQQDWTALSTNQPGDTNVFLKQTGDTSDTIGTSISNASADFDALNSTGDGLILSNTTPLVGIETIVLQLDYTRIELPPGSENIIPVLRIGGVLFDGDGLADFFLGTDLSNVPHPSPRLAGFGLTVDAGQYAWQWDLRGVDLSAGYAIEWDSPVEPFTASSLRSMQLDEGTEFAQVVPEPSAYAALCGALAIGFAFRCRRWMRKR